MEYIEPAHKEQGGILISCFSLLRKGRARVAGANRRGEFLSEEDVAAARFGLPISRRKVK